MRILNSTPAKYFSDFATSPSPYLCTSHALTARPFCADGRWGARAARHWPNTRVAVKKRRAHIRAPPTRNRIGRLVRPTILFSQTKRTALPPRHRVERVSRVRCFFFFFSNFVSTVSYRSAYVPIRFRVCNFSPPFPLFFIPLPLSLSLCLSHLWSRVFSPIPLLPRRNTVRHTRGSYRYRPVNNGETNFPVSSRTFRSGRL